jgi:hypothetical protein
MKRWTLMVCMMVLCSPSGYAQQARPSGSRGVIYERIDPSTGKSYVGQANSQGRFESRMREHTNGKGVAYEFRVLERPYRADLDVREEAKRREAIDQRGKENVENARRQMSEKRFEEATRRMERETASERRERRDGFDSSRYERGTQSATRRTERETFRTESQKRLERLQERARESARTRERERVGR